jgi:hypothetical protein
LCSRLSSALSSALSSFAAAVSMASVPLVEELLLVLVLLAGFREEVRG